MCSDPGIRHGGWSRCLFCSLQCALGIRDAGGGRLEAVFPPDGGLCTRGQSTGELAMLVRRGTVRDGVTGEDLSLSQGIERASAGLRDASGIDIIVDGNHRGELLAMVAALAAGSPERIRGFVSLPGEDLLLLEHAWSSGVRTCGTEAIGEADGLLVIGDAFSSHPRSAKPILRFKWRNRRSPVVVVDCAPRRTALFATHPVIVEPSRIPAAVANVIPEDAAAFPRQSPGEVDPTGGLERALAALAKCTRLAVVMASVPGRGCQWLPAAYYAGLLARVQGLPLGLLTQYGNARSAARFVANGTLQPIGLLSTTTPDGRAVVVLGEQDLCVPTSEGVEYVSRASRVVHVGLSQMDGAAALEFPGLSFFETAGSVLATDEEWESVPAAISAPVGIPSAPALLRSIMEGAGVHVDDGTTLPAHPESVTVSAGPVPVPLEGSGPLRSLLTADPEQFVDGRITRLTSLLGSRLPSVVLATVDCARFNIRDDSPVTVTSENGECVAMARSCMHQSPGVAVISCTHGDVKALFPWDLCGGLPIARPSRVSIAPSRSAV